MTRIVTFGNSHVGALKLAWDAAPGRWPGIAQTFFGMPGWASLKLRLLDDGGLGLPDDGDATSEELELSRKLNGDVRVDLTDVDLLVWAGFDWRPEPIARLLHSFDVEGLIDTGAARLMSLANFDAISEALVAAALPGEEWTPPGGPRLVLLGRPMPSEICVNDPGRRIWGALAEKGPAVADVFERHRARFAAAAARRGIDVFYQPEDTLTPTSLTQESYSRDSIKLVNGKSHPGGEIFHMNAAFGARCLDAVLPALAAKAAAAARDAPSV